MTSRRHGFEAFDRENQADLSDRKKSRDVFRDGHQLEV